MRPISFHGDGLRRGELGAQDGQGLMAGKADHPYNPQNVPAREMHFYRQPVFYP